jgi:vacuolar-type H+-ATPase subunit I/STV1
MEHGGKNALAQFRGEPNEQVDSSEQSTQEPVEEGFTEVAEETVEQEPQEEQVQETVEAETTEEPVGEDEDIVLGDEPEVPDYLSDIASSIGLDDIKDQKGLVEYVNSLKSSSEKTAEELKTLQNASPFANDEIAKLNQIATQGGDWKTYLDTAKTNYDNIPPEEFFKELNKQYFVDGNGVLDEDAYENYLSDFTPEHMRVEGKKLKDQTIKDREDTLSAIENQTQEAASQRQKAIEEAVTALNDTAKDFKEIKFNIGGKNVKMNVSLAEKNKALKNLTDGTINDLIIPKNKDGSINHRAALENSWLIENKEKIFKHLEVKTKNETTRDMMNELSNANVKKNGERPVANATKVSPAQSALETLRAKYS